MADYEEEHGTCYQCHTPHTSTRLLTHETFRIVYITFRSTIRYYSNIAYIMQMDTSMDFQVPLAIQMHVVFDHRAPT